MMTQIIRYFGMETRTRLRTLEEYGVVDRALTLSSSSDWARRPVTWYRIPVHFRTISFL